MCQSCWPLFARAAVPKAWNGPWDNCCDSLPNRRYSISSVFGWWMDWVCWQMSSKASINQTAIYRESMHHSMTLSVIPTHAVDFVLLIIRTFLVCFVVFCFFFFIGEQSTGASYSSLSRCMLSMSTNSAACYFRKFHYRIVRCIAA